MGRVSHGFGMLRQTASGCIELAITEGDSSCCNAFFNIIVEGDLFRSALVLAGSIRIGAA